MWFAPLMAPVLGALGLAVGSASAWEDGGVTVLKAFCGFGIFALPIGAPVAWLVAVVLGLPVLKCLQRIDRVSFPWIVGGAGCLGIVLPALLTGIISWPPSSWGYIGLLGYFGFMGLGVGWVFWLIAYKDWEGGILSGGADMACKLRWVACGRRHGREVSSCRPCIGVFWGRLGADLPGLVVGYRPPVSFITSFYLSCRNLI